MLAKTLLAVGALVAPTLASASELVMYWGQNSAGTQKSLGEYCQETAGDIYVISFLYEFGIAGPSLSLSSCSGTAYSNGMLHCPDVASDIKSCQAAGKKILLALGGAAGSYGFSDDSSAEDFAGTLWDLFGEGSSDTRPFDDAVVDGFDFDIENGDETGYVALVNKLRSDYFSQGSKTYYISAAPQCPYPDASVGELLANAEVDYAFIQFYNNYCSLTNGQFNWDTWQKFAEDTSPNKDIKLLVGLPGSTSAAGSGYADVSTVSSQVSSIMSSANFGGIMVWDASQAFSNVENGETFAAAMQNILGGSGSDSGSSSSTSASTTASSEPTTASTSSAQLETSSYSAAQESSESAETSTTTLTSVLSTFTTTAGGGDYLQNNVVQSLPSIAESSASSSPAVETSSAGTPTTADAQTAAGAAPAAATTTLAPGTCSSGTSCIDGKYAVCNFNAWVLFECPTGTECRIDEAGSAMCDWPQKKRDVHAHHVHRFAGEPNVVKV